MLKASVLLNPPPLKQGLRPFNDNKSKACDSCSPKPSSIKTRIKTDINTLIVNSPILAPKPSSIKTRIKTVVKSKLMSSFAAPKPSSIKTRIKTPNSFSYLIEKLLVS